MFFIFSAKNAIIIRKIMNMEIKNPSLYLAKILALEAKDILLFPIWWYTGGFLNFITSLMDFLADTEKSLAFFVWIKNIFVPMYGQRDWQGKLISFFIRVVQIIARGGILALISALLALVALFWLVLPLIIIYEISFQLGIWELKSLYK